MEITGEGGVTLEGLDRGAQFRTLLTARRGEVLHWESCMDSPTGWAPIVAFEDQPERERMLHPFVRVGRIHE